MFSVFLQHVFYVFSVSFGFFGCGFDIGCLLPREKRKETGNDKVFATTPPSSCSQVGII
jgi:hypothetical protein